MNSTLLMMRNSTRSHDPEGGGTDICANYRDKTPTGLYLLRNGGPPEYYPMLGIGFVLFIFNTMLLILETIKHSKYLRVVYFKLSSRVIMMLSSFWLFAATSFLGMVFVRGDIFLHFVSNTFESACFLAFFDCIVIHRGAIGEVFDGQSSMMTRVPPCCCCLFFLPKIKNTKRNLKRLRFAIIQLIFFQTLVAFMRVLTVFDCDYDPELTRVLVFDILVLLSFLLGMWALFILFKANKEKLAKYRYIQKFAGFKLTIVVSKVLYKILAFIAKGEHIPSYDRLGAKARASIWTNFVTVVVATLLLFFCRKLYTIEDYESIDYNKCLQYNAEEEKTSENDSDADVV